MVYLYDQAIVDDLKKSFNPENVPNSTVAVVAPEQAVGLVAQIQNDKIQFPIVSLVRKELLEFDSDLMNFTKQHTGHANVFDNKNNVIYKERSIPIKLSYDLNILTANVADMDEIIREILFKYLSMYFLTVQVPYESKRKIRFGIQADPNGIEIKSSTSNYVAEGQLYGSSITLNCQGCVLLHYTPMRLQRFDYDIGILNPGSTSPPEDKV